MTTPTATHRLDHEALDIQARAVTNRIGALEELADLAVFAARQAASLPELLHSITLVQQQVHAARKAVIEEARATGHEDIELARLLRINPADFAARYPL